jgi:small subunit ribosomal protein S1
LLEEQAEAAAAGTRARLEVGAVFPGKVTRIEKYGAFVDIGGIEGLLHISEMAYGRLEHPSEVVSLDQTLDVQVLKIEQSDDPRRREKIGLSIRSLARDPWDDVSKTLSVGQQIQGKVRRIEPFGAFVEVAPGLEGLVHISEMGGSERISSPRKVVDIGQIVNVSVLSIDAGARRIALSMDASSRASQAAEEQEALTKYAPSKQGMGTLGDLLNEQIDKKSKN